MLHSSCTAKITRHQLHKCDNEIYSGAFEEQKQKLERLKEEALGELEVEGGQTLYGWVDQSGRTDTVCTTQLAIKRLTRQGRKADRCI